MNSAFSDTRSIGHTLLKMFLEAVAFLSMCFPALSLALYYKALPELIPDLFFFGDRTVPKVNLLYLLVVQVTVYVLLFLFQIHPEWRMYSSKLLPLLRDEQTRKALYRFSSIFMMIAKTEAVFTINIIIMGVILGKDVTVLTGAMMVLMMFTFLFFRMDLTKREI